MLKEITNEHLLGFLKQLDNYNQHNDPDYDMSDDLRDRMHDMIDYLSSERVRQKKDVCDCKMSGSCRYEVIMYNKQHECRYKV